MTDFLKPINETHAIMRVLCYSLPTRLLSAACIFTVAMAFSARAAGPTTAVAVLHPTKGNQATGIIHFQPVSDGKVRVTATVENLAPNSVHAIHIHEFGDCTAPDATSAGGHYNPGGTLTLFPIRKNGMQAILVICKPMPRAKPPWTSPWTTSRLTEARIPSWDAA